MLRQAHLRKDALGGGTMRCGVIFSPMFSPQARIFTATYLAYVGYYFTRKNLPVVQPLLIQTHGWTLVEMGLIITAFQVAYAVGQVGAGALGDRYGARKTLFYGIWATILLSFVSGFAASVWLMLGIWTLNGLAQATGWPAAVKAVTAAYPRERRGKVMGWWTTNYQIGDTVATWITAVSIGALGWRWGFWIPALALAALVPVIFRLLPPAAQAMPERHETLEAKPQRHSRRALFMNTPFIAVCLINAALKFILYTFFFWSVTYLVEALGYDPVRAGMFGALIPMGGAVGAILTGWASDRLFSARRVPAAAILMAALAAITLTVPYMGATQVGIAVVFFFTGLAVYGPESVLAATAAVEFAPSELAGTAVGLVNAVASLGAALSGVVGAYVITTHGWDALYSVLSATAFAAFVAVLPLWNHRGRN
jgi:MFS transporter, OPA family, glycerol-3-phosphate transporter